MVVSSSCMQTSSKFEFFDGQISVFYCKREKRIKKNIYTAKMNEFAMKIKQK